MKLHHLRTCHLEKPIGYQMEKPVLSWKLEDDDAQTVISRIAVKGSDGSFYETDFSYHDSLGTTLDIELQPRTGYTWTISVKGEGNDVQTEIVSEEAYFETGKQDESWEAKWIAEAKATERLPIFYKKLPVKKVVSSARLYMCGLGLYEAYLGGEKIGDAYLTPGCNDYTDWLQVQTYDITREIQSSAEMTILIGDGWYKGRYGFTKYDGGFYGKTRTVIAEVRVVYEDGSTECFGTDETWSVKKSSIFATSVYDGEKRDDTLAEENGTVVLLEDSEQRRLTSLLTDNLSVPVRTHEEFPIELI